LQKNKFLSSNLPVSLKLTGKFAREMQELPITLLFSRKGKNFIEEMEDLNTRIFLAHYPGSHWKKISTE